VVGSGVFDPMLGTEPGKAVLGSGVIDPILRTGPGKAVVGSGVFDPILGTGPGKAVVGSGVFNPMLGTEPGKAVVGSGVFNPMLGTVCGGGGQACAKADMAAKRSVAPRTNRKPTSVATRVRVSAFMTESSLIIEGANIIAQKSVTIKQSQPPVRTLYPDHAIDNSQSPVREHSIALLHPGRRCPLADARDVVAEAVSLAHETLPEEQQ
jgi:hypothetical protein